MKKLSLLLLFTVAFIFVGCDSDDDKAQVVISFEGKLTEANSEFTTDNGEPIPPLDWGYYKSKFNDPSNNLEFSHYYSAGGFGGGFTYTNKTDVTTPGYSNNSAIAGKGKNGTTYLTVCMANPPQINLLKSDLYTIKGAWITNSTYAYLAIKDGNDGYQNKTKFEDGDWFKLTIIGYDVNDKKIGSIDFYLADYRDGKNTIIKDWTWVDFSPIANAEVIKFELSSTDNDEDYGYMNTPAYFCMDGITLEER
ncbi:DUF4465 domain-containing protein [Bacteroides sp. 519]|uniref:DUF4465 domain-containing protein n=1 Tax=Bacteroides sp. 519 TaxID=2302937 RepID=UPI0013D36943|nr:DUF4465 domain-containing protein [Bacteroides sp. 519]NDV59598.1 DUF4465 domain-containing protein [Bacteroides sp. 519]